MLTVTVQPPLIARAHRHGATADVDFLLKDLGIPSERRERGKVLAARITSPKRLESHASKCETSRCSQKAPVRQSRSSFFVNAKVLHYSLTLAPSFASAGPRVGAAPFDRG